jgi:glycosyltransferase involved in cell wall biosynthesis
MRVLLDALLKVVSHVPDVTLLVLSATPVDEQVQQPEYAPLRRTHLVAGGWLSGDDLAAAYHLADVVTTPSVYLDPFPTVNLEAMAAKTPVITTCYGGSQEAVVDGKTGFVLNPYHTDEFADKLRLLLTDAALRQRMGEAGYQRLIDEFSLQKQADTMLQIFRRVQS